MPLPKKHEPVLGRNYPFHGYAPGNYINRCIRCEEQFIGDKYAFICEDCAEQDAFHCQIIDHLSEKFHADIVSVEENAGSIWITLTDGRTVSILVTECENEDIPKKQKVHVVHIDTYRDGGTRMYRDAQGIEYFRWEPTGDVYPTYEQCGPGKPGKMNIDLEVVSQFQ